MTWTQDGTGEREFSGTGNAVLTGLTSAGAGAANSDYLILVISVRQMAAASHRFTAMTLTDDANPGDGGDLQEMMRVRIGNDDPITSEHIHQFWAIRNNDFANPIDIEAAPATLRMTAVADDGTFAINHLAVFIMRSTNMPLGGDLVDFMQGGICQVDTLTVAQDDVNEALRIVNALGDITDDFSCTGRVQGASAAITGTPPECAVQTYSQYSVLIQTHTFVNAGYTSVANVGTGLAANQCLAKTNTGDNTDLTLGAILFKEDTAPTGPFTPYFDGDTQNTATCEPELAGNPTGSTGAWPPLLAMTGNSGAGPDWWWRMNAAAGVILDIGIAQDRAGPTPPPINADAIVEGGDPQHEVPGPLPADTTNKAIFFDGLGDFYEIGVNGIAGELVASSTGTVGFFFSRASLDEANIVYSQGNDAYTAFWQFGFNAKRLELIVQTSAGNRVTLTGSIDHDGEYVEAVLTCDGSTYRLYDAGVEDTLATVVELGTGAEGDWFDLISADQSAVGARADATFTTETTGRASEIFIYDGDVLSAAEIAALAAASVLDGITGVPNTVGLVTFENVTFRNGAFADIRAEESTGLFKQVVKADRCKFLAGAQGRADYRPQIALFKGPAQVQFRGCEFDLEDTVGFGRGGIVGTAISTNVAATVDGSLIVSDCDFFRIGYLNGLDFLSPVMCEAAFGMTVEGNRLLNSFGTAVGWRADAQRVSVLNNQLGASSALGAIYCATGLNLRQGNAWTIRGNKMVGIGGPAINLNDGSNGFGGFAGNISILKNEINGISGSAIRVNNVADTTIEDNVGNGATNGVELDNIQGTIKVRRNRMDGCAITAYLAAQGVLQQADVTFESNTGEGDGLFGDGLLATQLRRVFIINNKLTNMDEGVGIGEIGTEAVFAHNQIEAVTPFSLLPATTQVGLTIGRNQITDLGNANTITVTTATIEVNAHYHTILSAVGPINLDTIDGPAVDGFVLILRRALFSNDITLRDGIDNLNLGADFVMNVDNDQVWLVRDGTDWNQLARAEAL